MQNTEAIGPFLEQMVETGASDLFLTVGIAPSLRVEDKIISLNMPPLEQDDINVLLDEVLTDEQKNEFRERRELNIAVALDNKERFRINCFWQMHNKGMVIRRIKSQVPLPEKLGLPEVYGTLVMEKRGLVLIVGPTGCGKSTSMAAMLQHRNMYGSGHVITIEDPIEYVFESEGCIFTQREVGVDTTSYQSALKNAVRQSPDVIMIGEIRDRETLESALLFCETGHLVMATLHANNASKAIERITNFFPDDMQKQFLVTLSQNLKAILAQRLVEDVYGKLVLATEVLINEGLMRELIEKASIRQMHELMEKSRGRGMHTMDQCLYSLYEAGSIASEIALQEADNPGNLRLKISQEKMQEEYIDAASFLGKDPNDVNF